MIFLIVEPNIHHGWHHISILFAHEKAVGLIEHPVACSPILGEFLHETLVPILNQLRHEIYYAHVANLLRGEPKLPSDGLIAHNDLPELLALPVHQDEACVLGPLHLREQVVVKQPDHISLTVHLLGVELVLHEVVQQGPLKEREGVDDLEISGASST